MPKARLLLDWVDLNESDRLPLYRQLYVELRDAILDGRLEGGSLLPSSRVLSRELGISRNTVLNAYNQLIAEGYLETTEGSGTKVAELATANDATAIPPPSADRGRAKPSFSKRSDGVRVDSAPLLELPENDAFTPGVPAFDEFPAGLWARLAARQFHRMQPELADNDAHVGGYGPLREALSAYLRSSRMVRCEAEQIFIVNSSRAGFDLVCRLITDPGDAGIIEEPGYITARYIMKANGLRPVPVDVDREGLCIDRPECSGPTVKLAYVTPSHHWPTGVSLSATRRQQLLDWARRHNAWVIEDDYDSEFRFDSRPLATLQGLDSGEHVIYLGTFSKVMFPSLRIGYVVVPRRLTSLFRHAVYFAAQEPALHLQAALAKFIEDGHFFAHIRRMRQLYKRRQAHFVEALVRELGDLLPVERPAGGMQLMLSLPERHAAEAVSRLAADAGLQARPVQAYAMTGGAPNALHLGFAAVPDRRIDAYTRQLADAIRAAG